MAVAVSIYLELYLEAEARHGRPLQGALQVVSGSPDITKMVLIRNDSTIGAARRAILPARRELPCSKAVQFCLLPVPGTKRGAILYFCGEY